MHCIAVLNPEVKDIKTLEELKANNNMLKEVPDDLFPEGSKIVHIDLSGNKLEKLPSSLGNCTDAKCLFVHDNAFGKSVPY